MEIISLDDKDYACEDLYGTWTFSRRYSSILEYTGSMGKGWLHEYELFLLCEEDGGILAILPDTHLERFVKQDGQWVNRRGGTKEYTLTEHSDHFELVSWQEGTYKNYVFDKVGMYHFNSMNKLKEIVDQNGEKETFAYDSQGRMTSHIDRNRIRTTYAYNMDDNLLWKRGEGAEDIQKGGKRKRTEPLENRYEYNVEGQLVEASGGGVVYHYTYTPNGNVADKLVNGAKALSYTYTASGRVLSIKLERKTLTNMIKPEAWFQ